MAGLYDYIKANADPNIPSHWVHAVLTLFAAGDATGPQLKTLLENATGVSIVGSGQLETDLNTLGTNVNTGSAAARIQELTQQHAVMMACEMDTGGTGGTPNEMVTEAVVRNRLNMAL